MAKDTEQRATDEAAETRARILDVAQRLIQERGYNGFSYRDIADEVGIRAPTIHYYFPSKSDLAAALVDRYATVMAELCTALAKAEPKAWKRLSRYFQATRQIMLEQRHVCLCGVLAMEANSLPDNVRRAVDRFFDTSRKWLADQLREAKARGDIDFAGSADDVAAMIISTMQGSLLLSRASMSPEPFDAAIKQISRFLGF
ncbi:TetR/AcrR family transcriptional regulator [Dongia deserti]|uniref:TetR/AcrR family transcriptional regulator n=1 Tax=Dongia deserti TaxID=2268030 RepID=UPI000E64EB01|nr:TetR/AcrR family transcriptional regulator [Dongia deserti]